MIWSGSHVLFFLPAARAVDSPSRPTGTGAVPAMARSGIPGCWMAATAPWPDVLHADWAVPVPLSPERYEKRGYNQTEVIFRPWIESYAGWYDCLQRVRTTEAQWHLSRSERAANLHKAFSLQYGRPVRGKKILLLEQRCLGLIQCWKRCA